MSLWTMAQPVEIGAPEVGVSSFCRAAGPTADALSEVVAELSADGCLLDRFGLCLDRAMSLPEERRHTMSRETGPLLTASEWKAVGQQTWS